MNKKGFTLVELIAAILILSMLITIGVTTYSNISQSIKDSTTKDQFNKIRVAAENYAADTNQRVFFIQELILNGYLSAEEDGNYYHQTEGTPMNCYPISVSLVKGSYAAKIKEEDGPCTADRLAVLNDGVSITAVLVSGNIYTLTIKCPKDERIVVASNLGYSNLRESCPASGSYTLNVTVTQKPVTFTATYRPVTADDRNMIISGSYTIN